MPIRRALFGLVIAVSVASGQVPNQLGDKEFWQLFTSMSEQGGSFPSENFIFAEIDAANVSTAQPDPAAPDLWWRPEDGHVAPGTHASKLADDLGDPPKR